MAMQSVALTLGAAERGAGFAAVAQAFGLALATTAAASTLPSVSVVALYQTGEQRHSVDEATVVQLFAWAWALAWELMRCWSDAEESTRASAAAKPEPVPQTTPVQAEQAKSGARDVFRIGSSLRLRYV